jgi:hypothetical protein
MIKLSLGRSGVVVVSTLLGLQLLVLALSVAGFMQISPFCAGPRSSSLGKLFGDLHLLFVGLLVLGFLSLRFPPLRLPYAALLALALCTLPLQARLVSSGQLTCDVP